MSYGCALCGQAVVLTADRQAHHRDRTRDDPATGHKPLVYATREE